LSISGNEDKPPDRSGYPATTHGWFLTLWRILYSAMKCSPSISRHGNNPVAGRQSPDPGNEVFPGPSATNVPAGKFPASAITVRD
jgi:hypothetical protein